MGKITVTIDKDLMDIVPDYLEHRKSDCGLIENWLKENNKEEIRKLGHKMAGSGGGYGFDEISRIGKAVEKAGISGDLLPVGNLILELRAYLENLDIIYE